jgi:hypothetical protein
MSENMTIAQALRRIKKIKGLLAEHRLRATMGVSYLLDKVPAFGFADEEAAMYLCIDELLNLESRVAVANANTMIQDNAVTMSLAKAIRSLQEIKGLISFYQSLNLRSGVEKNRHVDWDDNLNKNITTVDVVTYVSDLTEQDRDLKVKDFQDHFESLNNLVEDANHKVLV